MKARLEGVKIGLGRAKNDPEKLVTPAIMTVLEKDGDLSVRAFFFGWWDFSFRIMFAYSQQQIKK